MLTTIGYILLAGLVGTSCMYAFMWSINRSGLARANMPRALGSFITGDYASALLPGVVIHYIGGMIFALGYGVLLGFFDYSGFPGALGLGAVIGMMHGIVVSFVLVSMVSNSHPLEEFRSAGLDVAAVHWAGHLVYGAAVGGIVGLSDARWVLL